MPATFESLGLTFLYPDNWVVADRDPEDGIDGATLDLPTGGFLGIERINRTHAETEGPSSQDELIESIEAAIAQEYGELEREDLQHDGDGSLKQIEFRFYYLDLVIISRLVFVEVDGSKFAIQIQAESRDFDTNEMVFAAIIKQIDPEIEMARNNS